MAAGSTVAVSAGCGQGSAPPGTPPPDWWILRRLRRLHLRPPVRLDAARRRAGVPSAANGAAPPRLVSTRTLCTQVPARPPRLLPAGRHPRRRVLHQRRLAVPPGRPALRHRHLQAPRRAPPRCPAPLTAYCQSPDAACGLGTPSPGAASPSPPPARAAAPPVCGCDGQVHASTCAAAAAGLDVSASGACATPGRDVPLRAPHLPRRGRGLPEDPGACRPPTRASPSRPAARTAAIAASARRARRGCAPTCARPIPAGGRC